MDLIIVPATATRSFNFILIIRYPKVKKMARDLTWEFPIFHNLVEGLKVMLDSLDPDL